MHSGENCHGQGARSIAHSERRKSTGRGWSNCTQVGTVRLVYLPTANNEPGLQAEQALYWPALGRGSLLLRGLTMQEQSYN